MASKGDTSRCVGSSAHDRQAGSVAATMNCATSSVPAPPVSTYFRQYPPAPIPSSHCNRNEPIEAA